MVASSKMPCLNCIICTGAPYRRPTSAARSSPKTGISSPSGVRTRGKVCLRTVVTVVRSKQDQVGKLACREPREPAAVIDLPECQAPVTIEAVPAQLGGLEPFAAHGLHGIPEDRLYMSYFYSHALHEAVSSPWAA